MGTNNEEIKRILDLMQSKQSKAEFDKMIKNNRTIYLCKKKGFPNLIKNGLIGKRKKPEKVIKQEKYWKDMKLLAAAAHDLLLDGCTCVNAARQLKTSEYTMRRALKMAGITQWPNKKEMFLLDEALELANKGFTATELAKKYNCTRQAVSEKFRKNGYKYNKLKKGYFKC